MRLMQALLWPLTLPYGAVVRLRARAYRAGVIQQHRLDGVAISVGNLIAGGTGKTPMVLWIAERLMAEGKRPGILTRGYLGRSIPDEDIQIEELDVDIVNSSSDEVRLMQARLGERAAFGVGPDRFARGQELVRQGVKWLILDDGFQHLRLARDVDIVLIDATNPFGGGHLLPAGRLREPHSALARVDIVVITRSDHAPAVEAIIRRDSNAPIFYARPQLDSVVLNRSENMSDVSPEARKKKLFAFCGIGNPSAFLADLRTWGFQIAGHKFFPDHHRYTNSDIQAIEREAERSGAESLICTEKDIFNLTEVRSFSADLFYCRISFRMDRPEDFWRAIVSTINSHRRKG
ncbi:MAG: tetraacyldisaccharide 4'-kinase [Candidatus Acidiferrales bacterium]